MAYRCITIVIAITLGCNSLCLSQTHLKGTVTGKDGLGLKAVAIHVPGTAEGSYTNEKGVYDFIIDSKPPFTVIFSSIGFKTDSLRVEANHIDLNVVLEPAMVLTVDEVIVAASRFAESFLSSPVAIEKIGIKELRKIPAPNFYDALKQLKGVDVVTSSLLMSAPVTRGFASSFTHNVNQLVDGMDNSSPGLNFSVSNIAGIGELDLASVELLPGAASALYGAGGTNGTILITSKDPFQYQGLSAQSKTGLMHVGETDEKTALYQQYALRYAKALNNKVAFKVNTEYIRSNDWVARDYRNFNGANEIRTLKPGDRKSDPGYDGINVYGDETGINMNYVAQLMADANVIPDSAVKYVPNQYLTRTGYTEKELVDYETYNLKLGGMLRYRIKPGLTATVEANYGRATTVLTGADRYSLRGIHIGQYKLELTGRNFTLRGYTTQENSGRAYNATVLGQLVNESWKSSLQWFPEYVGAFLAAKQQGFNDDFAHIAARGYADKGMPDAGSDKFHHIKDSLIQLPIPSGAKFTDKSSLYQYEGMYDLTHLVKIVQLQAGASYRRYRLNSDGTIFDDKGKKLTVDQTGVYLQATKKLLDEKLKLTAAARYDELQNFEARITPRAAIVYTFLPANNFRVSYQEGYRPPTNQDQYIDLDVARARLIGGLPQLFEKYDLQKGSSNPGFELSNFNQYNEVYQSEYTKNINSGDAPDVAKSKAAAVAEAILIPYEAGKFRPETVRSYEAGYRGMLSKKLMVDAYSFFSLHDNFIGGVVLLQANNGPQPVSNSTEKYYGTELSNELTRKVYATTVNLTGAVKVFGWGAGVDYLLPYKFLLNANISYNKLSGAPAGYRTFFNSPDYRANIGVSKEGIYKYLGFNIAWRWQNSFMYESSFGDVRIPANSTIDALLNYRIPQYNLNLKLGGSNVLNHFYRNATGRPSIGGLYYLAIGYNL
jgi:iron complex outermembrane receptor protein